MNPLDDMLRMFAPGQPVVPIEEQKQEQIEPILISEHAPELAAISYGPMRDVRAVMVGAHYEIEFERMTGDALLGAYGWSSERGYLRYAFTDPAHAIEAAEYLRARMVR